MGDLHKIGEAIGVDLSGYAEKASWFDNRDEIMNRLAEQIKHKTTTEWLEILETAGIWCSEVMTYAQSLQHEGVKVLGMQQQVTLPDGSSLSTTRCPIRINGQRLYSDVAAPRPGAQTESINHQFNLL